MIREVDVSKWNLSSFQKVMRVGDLGGSQTQSVIPLRCKSTLGRHNSNLYLAFVLKQEERKERWKEGQKEGHKERRKEGERKGKKTKISIVYKNITYM